MWISKSSSSTTAYRGAVAGQGTDCFEKARKFEFDQSYRPCRLQKFVYGFPGDGGDWPMQGTLDSKLFDLVQRHCNGRATIVFCPTRKTAQQAAEALKSAIEKSNDRDNSQAFHPRPWHTVPSQALYQESGLRRLAHHSIAYHHAGLSIEDRRLVEAEFRLGHVGVLCSTTTLAVGVNLPAYCVVVRGTRRYENGAWSNLSETDLVQMLGRAGRPQFDREGVAVIMTEKSQISHYEAFVEGQVPIESTLHLSLIEHINSEIALRDGCNLRDLELWIQNTFLYVRLQQRSDLYQGTGVFADLEHLSPQETVAKFCAIAVKRLKDAHLIKVTSAGILYPTEHGDTLSRWSVSFETMSTLMRLEKASVADLLKVVSEAKEFQDLRLRAGEKSVYHSVRNHSELVYPLEKVVTVSHKINWLLQASLAALPLTQVLKKGGKDICASPDAEAWAIWRNAQKIIKATLDTAVVKKDAQTLLSAQELTRSLNGRFWDHLPVSMQQVDDIGAKSIKVLVTAGIKSYPELAQTPPERVELLLGRNPPFGFKVTDSAASLPQFDLQIEQVGSGQKATDGCQVSVIVSVSRRVTWRKGVKPRVKTKEGQPYFLELTVVSSDRQRLYDFRRMPLSKLCPLDASESTSTKSLKLQCCLSSLGDGITVFAACDQVPGSLSESQLLPLVEPHLFPSPVQRRRESSDSGSEAEGSNVAPESLKKTDKGNRHTPQGLGKTLTRKALPMSRVQPRKPRDQTRVGIDHSRAEGTKENSASSDNELCVIHSDEEQSRETRTSKRKAPDEVNEHRPGACLQGRQESPQGQSLRCSVMISSSYELMSTPFIP